MHRNQDTATHATFELRAFAANHRSEVVDCGRRLQADLISVSYSNARLRVPDRERSSHWQEGHGLVLNLCIDRAEGATENVACLVRWVQGNDLGVDFHRPLPMAVSELQGWLEQ